MKTVASSMLLLISSAGAQPVTQSGVRDAFRKVVQRASLSILRSATNRNRDETVLDAEKAIDEVKIEANSPEEEAVVSLLVRYQLAVLANNSTRSLMESQLKLDALANGFDTGAPTTRRTWQIAMKCAIGRWLVLMPSEIWCVVS